MPPIPRQQYITDLTDKQWNDIKKLLPPPKRITKRNLDRQEIINAVLYLVHTGCQWRNLPHDFPNWKSIYNVWYQWRNDGTWQRIHDYLVRKIRKSVGKKPQPTACIIDSQSIKNDASVSESTGYDSAKNVQGRKRHLLVDTLGLLHRAVVHSADVQDQDGAKDVLQGIKESNGRLKVVFADSAYKRSELPVWAKEQGFLLQPVLRPAKVNGFVILPKRWIVERTHAWVGRSRRHSKDYEHQTKSSETMILIAMTRIMLNYCDNNKL